VPIFLAITVCIIINSSSSSICVSVYIYIYTVYVYPVALSSHKNTRLNTDIMLLASQILHASIAEITAQLLHLFASLCTHTVFLCS